MKMRTVDAARGRWRGILTELGIDDSYLLNRHGECPICGGRDRFRYDDKDGNGTYYCNSHGAGDGMKLALDWTGADFKDLAKRIDGMIGNIEIDNTPARPKSNPRKILKKSRRAGKIVADYLAARGLELPPYLGECPSHDYWETNDSGELVKLGSFPCMVASLRDEHGTILGSHITFLDGNRKANVSSQKKMNGEVLNGAVARLYAATPSIGIAEGIETAIAAKMLYGINTWAALNTSLLEKFTPPTGTTELTIFADNDANYAGQKSAYVLANRLAKTGLSVKVIIPEVVGTDFNDVLLAKKNNDIR